MIRVARRAASKTTGESGAGQTTGQALREACTQRSFLGVLAGLINLPVDERPLPRLAMEPAG